MYDIITGKDKYMEFVRFPVPMTGYLQWDHKTLKDIRTDYTARVQMSEEYDQFKDATYAQYIRSWMDQIRQRLQDFYLSTALYLYIHTRSQVKNLSCT